MKITVLHGDYIVKSRDRLITIINGVKKRGWEVIRVDEKKSLSESLVSSSLFGKESLYVSESPGKFTPTDLSWLKQNSSEMDLNFLIWHKNKIGVKVKNTLPKDAKIEEFKLPQRIWSLLDSIYPGNAKISLNLLHEVSQESPLEFVFALMARQMRDLYWVSNDPDSLNYPSWRKSKLKNQADRFSTRRLKRIISLMSQADIDSKTGVATLSTSLDLILAAQLE